MKRHVSTARISPDAARGALDLLLEASDPVIYGAKLTAIRCAKFVAVRCAHRIGRAKFSTICRVRQSDAYQLTAIECVKFTAISIYGDRNVDI